MTRHLTSAFVLAMALAAPAPWAQEPQTDPLYKTELLIFSYLSQAAATAEVWEPTPSLSYPDPARFLVNPPRIEAMVAEFDEGSEIDAYGRQLITTGIDTRRAKESGTIPPPEPANAIIPFQVLDRSELELGAGAASLQRSGRYNVLFHEAWIQPLKERSSALPIVLDQSGDTGDWPALQGSVKFYLSRYLHLETNLWLNTHGDYLPGRWWMPAPPLGPPSVLIDGQPLYIARAEEPSGATGKAFKTAPTPGNSGGFQPFDPEAEALGADGLMPWVPPWSYRHAVLFQQSRRMRSEEVHYLDHPMLGLVVKLTPVESDNVSGDPTPDT